MEQISGSTQVLLNQTRCGLGPIIWIFTNSPVDSDAHCNWESLSGKILWVTLIPKNVKKLDAKHETTHNVTWIKCSSNVPPQGPSSWHFRYLNQGAAPQYTGVLRGFSSENCVGSSFHEVPKVNTVKIHDILNGSCFYWADGWEEHSDRKDECSTYEENRHLAAVLSESRQG